MGDSGRGRVWTAGDAGKSTPTHEAPVELPPPARGTQMLGPQMLGHQPTDPKTVTRLVALAVGAVVLLGVAAAGIAALTSGNDSNATPVAEAEPAAEQAALPPAVRDICDQVVGARSDLRSLRNRVPNTGDFDVISGWLMDVYDITDFLSGWADIPDDARFGGLRNAARAALAHTGQYGDGTNPITGSELTSNLRSADRYWSDLEQGCSRAR